jgi:hypothetical protein
MGQSFFCTTSKVGLHFCRLLLVLRATTGSTSAATCSTGSVLRELQVPVLVRSIKTKSSSLQQ